MANISSFLNTIKTAIYGRDMRQSLHDAIKTVNDGLETEISDRKSAVSGEASARQSADTALGSRIDGEITNRQSADTALGSRIDGEITNRQSADTALGGRIDAEASERKNADAALRTDVTVLQGKAHAHGNKSALDNLTQSVIANSHTHGNKTLLDNITSADVARWDENGDLPTWYREYVDGRINELLEGLGVNVYDGGYFGDDTVGKTLDGGLFTDAAPGKTVDGGDFEPLEFNIGGTGLSDRVRAIEEKIGGMSVAEESRIDGLFESA